MLLIGITVLNTHDSKKITPDISDVPIVEHFVPDLTGFIGFPVQNPDIGASGGNGAEQL